MRKPHKTLEINMHVLVYWEYWYILIRVLLEQDKDTYKDQDI